MEAKRDTKSVGDRSEIEVAYALYDAGFLVLVPMIGENHRYDLIADDARRLLKVQVKTGRLRDGVIIYNCCSSHAHRGGTTRPYFGEIDAFGVYCPETGGVYLIPIEEGTKSKGSLRVGSTTNRQAKRVRWADDYLVGGRARRGVGFGAASGVQAEAPELPL